MSISTRHQAVRRLDQAAFEGLTGREDITTFKQGIYEIANQLQVLEVVALDADLLTYNLQRAEVLPRPAMPAAGATAVVSKHYELLSKEYNKQNTALVTLKGQVLQAMDQAVMRAIEEPIHGSLRLSVRTIIERLVEEYNSLEINELKILKDQWMALRWDASGDLLTFLANFREQHALLAQNHFGAQEGEQVAQLKLAVGHVTAFADMAHAAFHQAHPLRNDQTIERLCVIYRRVYRSQYVNSTAAQHHLANQARHKQAQSVPAPPQDNVVIDGIMASVRENLSGATVGAEGAAYMAAEVAKTIQRCLKPRERATPRGGKAAGPKQPMTEQQPGMCHMHPNATRVSHTFAECTRNPANQKA